MKLNIAAARESSIEKAAALNTLNSARSNKQGSNPALSARMSYNSVALASHRQKSNDLIAQTLEMIRSSATPRSMFGNQAQVERRVVR